MSLDPLWTEGDDLRALITLGLPLGQYTAQLIRSDMNLMARDYTTLVPRVIDLLDQWDELQELVYSNNSGSSDGRTLVKADVLEWAVDGSGSSGPTAELGRITYQLRQYFSFSTLVSSMQSDCGGNFRLVRS
jgi:hypothetical protein